MKKSEKAKSAAVVVAMYEKYYFFEFCDIFGNISKLVIFGPFLGDFSQNFEIFTYHERSIFGEKKCGFFF